MSKRLVYGGVLLVLIIGFIFLNQQILKAERGYIMGLELKSTAFEDNQKIPQKYTCEGQDISPPLYWENVPEGTASFALISDDPDAPVGVWIHWVIYNIPGNVSQLQEAVPTDETLDDGTLQGINGFRRIGYGGPCPPAGSPHRYFFKLYALDTVLELAAGASKSKVEQAMQGHILAKTELIGLYNK